MGFLKRLTGRDQGPDWAPFLSGAQAREFLEAVAADLRRRDLQFQVADGVVDVEGGGQLGLANLAQVCNQAGRGEWQTVIARHFDAVLVPDDAEAFRGDFEAARPMLKPRIYMVGDLPDDAAIVSSQIGAGLISVLTYDLPTSVRTIHRDDADSWSVPIDELFAIALANIASAPDRPERTDVPFEGGVFHALHGDSFFVTSEILRLREHLGDAPNGALVAIPNRHILLFHPLLDLSAVVAVQFLIQMTIQMFREGPGSVSPNLYWWHDGALTQLPYDTDRKGVQFFPPDEFVQVLNGLPPPPA
jgi:hypothetical protein